jgi:hypothetical protein
LDLHVFSGEQRDERIHGHAPSLMFMPWQQTSGMLCLQDGDGDRDVTPEIAPSHLRISP